MENNQENVCPKCKGSSQVIRKPKPGDAVGSVHYMKCPDCHGTGRKDWNKEPANSKIEPEIRITGRKSELGSQNLYTDSNGVQENADSHTPVTGLEDLLDHLVIRAGDGPNGSGGEVRYWKDDLDIPAKQAIDSLINQRVIAELERLKEYRLSESRAANYTLNYVTVWDIDNRIAELKSQGEVK